MHRKYERSLSRSEERYLRLEAARLRKLAHRELGARSISISIVVGAVAGAGFGYFFASYLWHWSALVGAAAACLLKIFAGLDYHKRYSEFSNLAKNINIASVTEVEASRIVELAEFEDLGVTYCFEVAPDKFFVLSGQEYYETPRFPCLNFEVIEIEGLLYTIRPKSEKCVPDRVVPEEISKEICFYESEVLIDGCFHDIEKRLATYHV